MAECSCPTAHEKIGTCLIILEQKIKIIMKCLIKPINLSKTEMFLEIQYWRGHEKQMFSYTVIDV